ncbi:MAG TPA: hypothetical protein VJ124_25495 [Pyrinomonadaceae bacterium]|nr:hypothetical protein [Pyrinomonadaceae bacterium]
MRKRFLGLIVILQLVSILGLAQQARQRPAGQRQAPPDLKITYRVTSAGQPMESTTMIKGARERNEMRTGYGMDTVSITQCDLRRTIQLSERAKKYVITSMAQNEATPAARDRGPTSSTPADKRRGGVVTYTTSSIDTGERKEMFGFTARHVKSSIKIESSPDACSPVNQRMETDGWYIDLSFGLDCEPGRFQPSSSASPTAAGCRDQVRFRREGAARTGYPLIETMRMYGPDGKEIFTTTKEVLDLSRQPLDAALFEIPAGYTEAQSMQELYMMSAPEAVAQMTKPAEASDVAATTPTTTVKNGTLRVGVVTFNNKSGREVAIDSLRQGLVSEITGSGIDAVPLNAISQMEAEAEARAKDCDFILYTDISALKSSPAKKLGGVFGRVTGVEGLGKTDARVDFKLFAVGESMPRLQSTATAKQEGDEASAQTALASEAKMVVSAIRKKS